jgi:hypothetical protein
MREHTEKRASCPLGWRGLRTTSIRGASGTLQCGAVPLREPPLYNPGWATNKVVESYRPVLLGSRSANAIDRYRKGLNRGENALPVGCLSTSRVRGIRRRVVQAVDLDDETLTNKKVQVFEDPGNEDRLGCLSGGGKKSLLRRGTLVPM